MAYQNIARRVACHPKPWRRVVPVEGPVRAGGQFKEIIGISGLPRHSVTARRLVPVEGIEPPTFGLQNRCSTAELNRHLYACVGRHPERHRGRTIPILRIVERKK